MKVWKRLRHPNVMPFIGSIVFESPMRALFLISPWMENGDLGTYIKANPKADRLRLLTQIATGLEYLHTSDVVHGDLKAANVFISGTGDARIGDFGLSEVVSEMTGDTQGYSSAWKYGGNPRWQAPELWSDYKRTKPSDMFAFGRVIYEVCAAVFRRFHPLYFYAIGLHRRLSIRPSKQSPDLQHS
ncbi:hypothetical protein BOTBODRAFT_105820 [Botryobasidium botryosum FD-172 SS1]|uniref:Protein kinase domain-containing protein n=1 Tax=Botryobasidium botryosum (strain FD-172 SS1) TaxID=930990 RepID=A0A067MNN0_BOTB1|nr:hypothetical protein BOTBODRAFT_105820 [Botryobasidium botryosum FD-172 SS1]